MNIITKRPEGMSFSDYKQHLKKQSRVIREHAKGTMVWFSKRLDFMQKRLPEFNRGVFRGSMKQFIKKTETVKV